MPLHKVLGLRKINGFGLKLPYVQDLYVIPRCMMINLDTLLWQVTEGSYGYKRPVYTMTCPDSKKVFRFKVYFRSVNNWLDFIDFGGFY